MAVYFFHLESCGERFEDFEGEECASLEIARIKAEQSGRAIMADEVAHGKICLGCRIEVTDVAQQHLLTVEFKDLIRVAQGH